MLRKVALAVVAAAVLGTIGYTAMGFAVVMRSDATTVLSFAASESLPLAPRLLANWRVQSWDGCPAGDSGRNLLGMTLRGYGLDGFDNNRVLATASRLIELGCDIDQRNRGGHTALHEAILYNEPDVVRFLLAHGADPGVTIGGPGDMPSEPRRYFSGMDSIRFTEELQRKSSLNEDRGEILKLLQASRG